MCFYAIVRIPLNASNEFGLIYTENKEEAQYYANIGCGVLNSKRSYLDETSEKWIWEVYELPYNYKKINPIKLSLKTHFQGYESSLPIVIDDIRKNAVKKLISHDKVACL